MKLGEVIDQRFKTVGLCSAAGGMGTILFVEDLSNPESKLVLKYCKAQDEKLRKRFAREVRLLDGFRGNPLVAQIHYFNVVREPPYYVMEYYPEGDLTKMPAQLKHSPALQNTESTLKKAGRFCNPLTAEWFFFL